MNRYFFGLLGIVALFHIAVVSLFLVTGVHREMVDALKPGNTGQHAVDTVITPPVPAQHAAPLEEVPVAPDARPQERLKSHREIALSTNRVVRSIRQDIPAPPSAEKINEVLREGLPGGNPVAGGSGSNAEDCYRLIRDVMYKAWLPPDAAEAGHDVAVVAVEFNDSSEIISRKLEKPSGNEQFDGSVMRAVNSVSKIDGLPARFLADRKVVTVTFQIAQ